MVHATGQAFASPTESEFSDAEGPDSVKNWTEDQVCEYLRSVKCGEYEKLFRKNNINGENLLEMDKEVLKEMGIDKVGDRVRLFLGIKKLRTKAYANQKRRNRVSYMSAYATLTIAHRQSNTKFRLECFLITYYRILSGGLTLSTPLLRQGHHAILTLVAVLWPARWRTRDTLDRLTCQAWL